MLILMIVIFLLIMLIIVIYVFLNYKQKKDNFLNNKLLSDSYDNRDNWDNLEFKNIEIEKFLSNKPKYKDIDELMNETKEGETIYDITSVKLKNK